MLDVFAERLRALMAARRFTRKSLADECGVSAQLVQKWTRGECAPKSSALMTICRVCGCSVEWLLDPAPLDFTGRQEDTVRKVLREEGLI